jgi:hypothetical protein
LYSFQFAFIEILRQGFEEIGYSVNKSLSLKGDVFLCYSSFASIDRDVDEICTFVASLACTDQIRRFVKVTYPVAQTSNARQTQLSSLAHPLVILNKEPDSSAEGTGLGTLNSHYCASPCRTEVDGSWQLHQPLKEAEA